MLYTRKSLVWKLSLSAENIITISQRTIFIDNEENDRESEFLFNYTTFQVSFLLFRLHEKKEQ